MKTVSTVKERFESYYQGIDGIFIQTFPVKGHTFSNGKKALASVKNFIDNIAIRNRSVPDLIQLKIKSSDKTEQDFLYIRSAKTCRETFKGDWKHLVPSSEEYDLVQDIALIESQRPKARIPWKALEEKVARLKELQDGQHFSIVLSQGARSFIVDKKVGSILEAHLLATAVLEEAGNAYTYEDAGPWKLEIFDDDKEPVECDNQYGYENVVAVLYGVPRNWHYA
jgi:hypothetical protein